MESAVDNAISKFLNLSEMQQFVLESHLAFHNKAHVLGCLVSLSSSPELEKSKYKKTINKMLSYSADRNKIAHHMFSYSDNTDGVQFLVTSAKGELKFPDYDWSIAKFEESFVNFLRCRAEIVEMTNAVSRVSESPSFLKMLLGLEQFSPSEAPPATGYGDHPLLPPLIDHTLATTTATSETEPKTPPSDQD